MNDVYTIRNVRNGQPVEMSIVYLLTDVAHRNIIESLAVSICYLHEDVPVWANIFFSL